MEWSRLPDLTRRPADYEESAPGLLAQLVQIQTPTDGLHIAYRCATIGGNPKPAQKATGETLIETRGEGGYVVTLGSPAACHSSGKPYKLIFHKSFARADIAAPAREL